jgi:site-specific recombinase XerD
MTISDALERFLVQLQADGRSPHTIGQYRRHIRLLVRWAHDVRPRCAQVGRIGHEDVAAFLAHPVATGRRGGGQKLAASANCLRSSLKSFLSYCHRAGYIPHDPGRLIRRAICAPPPPRALSSDEEKRLLAVLSKAKGSEEQRDYALFHLMLSTGIRVGSATSLDRSDVDLARGEVQLKHAKGNRQDSVFLGKAIRTHLKRYLLGKTAGPLFTGHNGQRVSTRHVHRRFRWWLKRAGITGAFSPHSLRHSFGMKIYGKTSDLLLTKLALHHRSIVSTLTYAHASEDQLRKVI